MHHSIRERWEGRKRFLERVFKVEAFRKRYLAAMTTLAREQARPERIVNMVTEIAAPIRSAVKEGSNEKLSRFETVVTRKPLSGGFFGPGYANSTMLIFVKDRAASVDNHLDGKDEGQELGRQRPGDDRRPLGPPPFEEMVETALVKALNTDKDKQLGREEFVGGF